jgi:hypothetical protein
MRRPGNLAAIAFLLAAGACAKTTATTTVPSASAMPHESVMPEKTAAPAMHEKMMGTPTPAMHETMKP